jgi:hypothetical protein
MPAWTPGDLTATRHQPGTGWWGMVQFIVGVGMMHWHWKHGDELRGHSDLLNVSRDSTPRPTTDTTTLCHRCLTQGSVAQPSTWSNDWAPTLIPLTLLVD